MYRVLGADQNEYGPVTADQIRQWILERRLNANSLARSDGDTGWKPLSFFPEFAPAVVQAAAPASSVTQVIDERQNPLALTGFICSLLSILCCCTGPLFAVLGIAFSVIALIQINNNPTQRGKQLAIAGIILGVIGLAEFTAMMVGGTFADYLRRFA